MDPITDMNETRNHDRFEGHGFRRIAASGPAVVDEFPYRSGEDRRLDYRQPGFSIETVEPNKFRVRWDSFVAGILAAPAGLELEGQDGQFLVLTLTVDFGRRPPHPYHPPQPNGLGVFSGEVTPHEASLLFMDEVPSETTQTEAGPDTLVGVIGSVVDGSFSTEAATVAGNLFLSRPPIGLAVILTNLP